MKNSEGPTALAITLLYTGCIICISYVMVHTHCNHRFAQVADLCLVMYLFVLGRSYMRSELKVDRYSEGPTVLAETLLYGHSQGTTSFLQ